MYLMFSVCTNVGLKFHFHGDEGVTFFVIYLACYGASVTTAAAALWLCQRCEAGVSPNQDCCLCLLCGGALKATDDGRWAHLVCALHIPDITFGDEQQREPIFIEKITRTGHKLVSSHIYTVKLSTDFSPSFPFPCTCRSILYSSKIII